VGKYKKSSYDAPCFVINLYVDKLVDNVNKSRKPLKIWVVPVSNYVDSVDMSEN
jgi:hypothetical protein